MKYKDIKYIVKAGAILAIACGVFRGYNMAFIGLFQRLHTKENLMLLV